MDFNYFDHIVHGGDYNPDQWIRTKEVWDEDMRLMKLAHINSASIGIFSWATLEPSEDVYNFQWLDEIMDKCADNGIDVVLATPSGARPAWLAQKYPEVLRTEVNGKQNEFGIRHNHCLTSPIYRKKVQKINRLLADRYKNHPALKMWHISNEYSGECHCEMCQNEFREFLKKEYNNDLEKLNAQWWTGFWSHTYTDWSQINSPKDWGEPLVVPLKLAWRRFVTERHISFYENEIVPLRELTPNIPITTNLMGWYDAIDYQKLAKHLDIVSWDNYPDWQQKDNKVTANRVAFLHDLTRGLKNGQPYFMMETTPCNVNWQPVNKIPAPGQTELAAIQAIAHGSDSVQYFQFRKGQGGHEKFHGAVVDHLGNENTRVFRSVTHVGESLEKLSKVVNTRCDGKVAIIYDWENKWAVNMFCGYNNEHRDYNEECMKWYKPFRDKGIGVDVISMEDDYSKYDLIIAPFLYLMKDGTIDRIEEYVKNGGKFVTTYLFANVDRNDLCYLKGFPGGKLKEVFGIWAEETDSIPENMQSFASFNGKDYLINHVCDIIHSNTAEVLGEYKNDFYKGLPSVTKNIYGKGEAYYCAFRNDEDFAEDFCDYIIKEANVKADTNLSYDEGVYVKKRNDYVFVLNYESEEKSVSLDREYLNIMTNEKLNGKVQIPPYSYLVLE